MKTIKELLKDNIEYLAEYRNKYYVSTEKSKGLESTAIWVIDKETGKIEFIDSLNYSFDDYEDENESLFSLARRITSEKEIEEFKQFLLSF